MEPGFRYTSRRRSRSLCSAERQSPLTAFCNSAVMFSVDMLGAAQAAAAKNKVLESQIPQVRT
jgi:hypothetical protein